MKILTGKKVLLAPMRLKDLEYMLDIYEQEGNKKLYGMNIGNRKETIINIVDMYTKGHFQGWVAYTKQGKASQKVGAVFLTNDPESHIVRVNGAVDKSFLKGLSKHLKNDKNKTYTQEALELVTGFCFKDLKKERVEANIEYDNRLAVKLVKKAGYIKEGTLKHFIKFENEFKDLIMFRLLKGEWNNGNGS